MTEATSRTGGPLPGALAGLFALAWIAACSSAGSGPPPQGGPRLLAGLNADGAAVELLVEDLPPGAAIREVWLDGPQDARLSGLLLGETLGPEAPGGSARPAVGIGATGGSSSGIDPSVSLSWGPTAPGSLGHWRDSHWLIPVPAALRPSLPGGGWRVELHYLDADGIARVMRRPVRG